MDERNRYERERTRLTKVAVSIECPCGTVFLHHPGKRGPVRKYCTLKCLQSTYNNRRRALLREAFVDPVVPQRIFERDNWTCHICENGINRRLHYMHPYSATVDHIIPLAKGGLHSESNVAAAHRYCNRIKGASAA